MTSPGTSLVCPYCRLQVLTTAATAFIRNHSGGDQQVADHGWVKFVGLDGDYSVEIYTSTCPRCSQLIVTVAGFKKIRGPLGAAPVHVDTYMAWPRGVTRLVAAEVPEAIASDYREASMIVTLSPKASAALSRRCLQAVLVDPSAGKALAKDLAPQIQEVMPQLPSNLRDNIDLVRKVGNFAAHPNKSTQTGMIIDVEEHEAAFLLDVLDLLFDHYYVAPAKSAATRAAIEAKYIKTPQKP